MARKKPKLSPSLPRNWPRHIKRAVLDSIGLYRLATPLARANPAGDTIEARRPRGKLELAVGYVGGFRQLRVVELREAA